MKNVKFEVTKADERRFRTLVDNVAKAETKVLGNVRTHVLKQFDDKHAFVKLADAVRSVLNTLGNSNITPTIKSALSLDQLSDKSWAMLKLMTSDYFKKTIILAIKSDNPSNYTPCLAVGLDAIYNWSERYCRANEVKLDGTPKKKTKKTPKTPNSAGSVGSNERSDNDKQTLSDQPMTKEQIVAMIVNSTNATDKKIVLEALAESLQTVKARAGDKLQLDDVVNK